MKKKWNKKKLKTSCFLTKFLYTNEINKIGIKNKFLKTFFLGAYPADIVPEKINFPCCWIWNTDKQNEGGKHWIGIWLTSFFLIVLLNPFLFIHENIGKI